MRNLKLISFDNTNNELYVINLLIFLCASGSSAHVQAVIGLVANAKKLYVPLCNSPLTQRLLVAQILIENFKPPYPNATYSTS